MAMVHIPSLMRDVTRGQEQVEAPGHTLRQVIDALEQTYPGSKARLCEGGRLKAGVMATVDGRAARLGLAQPVGEASTIHFLPVLGGGEAMLGYDVDALYHAIVELRQQGRAAVLVTVVAREGSGPVRPGSKLLVLADGATLGTVGGGALERLATARARELLERPGSLLVNYALTEHDQVREAETTGMLCGGQVTLFYECLGHALRVYIYGAGHVGQALVACLARLPGYTIVVDPRAELMAQLAGADRLVTDDYTVAFQDEPPPAGGFYVIATPGHAQDYEVLKRLFSSDWAPRYVGMVASRGKAATLVQRLRAELGGGLDLSALYAPVGLDLGGSTPEEIAVSITAEILAVHYGQAGHRHLAVPMA